MLVWIHMRPADGVQVAGAQTGALVADRLIHFHDPRRRAGKALASAVGAGRSVVWDTYLFFAPGVRWEQTPPAPEDWAHQLDAPWAEAERFRQGDQLSEWLRQTAGRDL